MRGHVTKNTQQAMHDLEVSTDVKSSRIHTISTKVILNTCINTMFRILIAIWYTK